MAGPPRGRRGVSMASDYSSSTTSTREGSHTTCETDEQDRERERPNQLPFSPSQDSATTSLASFPLGSQQAQLKIVGLRGTATELSTASTIPWDTQFETSEHGPQAPVSHSRSGQRIFKDVYDGDRSRSSSVSLISPNVETHIAGFFHAMDIQPPPLPLHANHHRSGVYFHQGPEDRLPHEAHQFHSITGSGKNEADPLMHIRAPSGSLHPEPALIRGRLDRSGEQYLHDNGRRHNSAEPRRVDWVDQGELTPVETSRSPVEERSIHVGQAGMPLRPISPVRSPGYGASHGSASASLPQPWEDLNVARRPCPHHVRQVSQSSRPVKDSGPAVSPSQQRHSVRSERSKPRAREYFGSSRHQQVDNVYMAVSQSLHVTTTFPNRPYHPHEQNPRTPVSAASDIDESNGYGAAYHHSTHSPSTIMTHDAYGRPRSRSSRNPSDINTVSPGVIAYDQGYLPRPLPVRSGATAVMDLSSQPSTPISRTGQHSPFNQRINVRPAMTDTAEIMSPQEQAGYGHLHPQHPHQQQQQQRPHRQKILPQERVLQPEVLHDEQSRAFETRHGYEFDGLRPELIDLTSPSSTPPLQQRFATPLSPPSPGAIRSIAIVDSRSKMLAPGQDLRGENGGSEGAGGRSIGSYDGRPMTGQWKTGTLSTGPRGPAPATLVGRKRPSESMYGTEDRDEGLGEGSHGGWHGSGIGDAMDISETGESGSAAFDANPLYRDGVEVVEPRKQKQQKLEKHGRQARQMQYPYAAFQAGMHPDETMPQHPRYVEQDQAPPLQQHHHQEFAIQVHQQPSTSRHSQMPSPTSNRLPRPSHPQQQMQAQEQAHYSYQSYQPSSPSYHVLQQKHQQHEPRTSPVSSYPSAAAAATAPPPSSSSSSSSSAASITRPYPRDNYGAPPALQIQQQQAHLQQQIRQDRMFQQQLQQRERQLQQQQQREMMPPPPVLPSGRLGETGSTMNSAGVPSDGEGEDSAALMPDMMRDLVRRQRR
ncbi:hypothetical protein BGZ54_001104 [Gamsiella multidivaricata]|nr:hypothetical protein BGZ54_001104 [Gamsiella multidivaricata]